MSERMERCLNMMKQQQLDAVLVADGCNMRYLSGFSGATGFLFISENSRIIMTDSRYTTQAKEEAPEFEVKEISNTFGYEAMTKELLLQDQIHRLGFEEDVMLYGQVVRFQKETGSIEWCQLGTALNDLRMIKDEEELACIAQAEHIGDEAFTHILSILRPGMTELDVAVELESHMKRNGAEALSFDTIVASGYHSAMPHAAVSNKKLENGDFLTMDFGCKYKGYCSDMTRTVVIGKASEQQKEIYNIVLEAQLKSLQAIKEGMTGAQVDAIARDIIKAAGYGQYFGHGLGHSVGLFIHEDPRISPMGKTVLKSNMTATIEPGIYVPGVGGVRIEDLVIVTKDGCRNLASSPKQLIEI